MWEEHHNALTRLSSSLISALHRQPKQPVGGQSLYIGTIVYCPPSRCGTDSDAQHIEQNSFSLSADGNLLIIPVRVTARQSDGHYPAAASARILKALAVTRSDSPARFLKWNAHYGPRLTRTRQVLEIGQFVTAPFQRGPSKTGILEIWRLLNDHEPVEVHGAEYTKTATLFP